MLLNHDVADDTLESLGQQGVNPKGNQFWIFIGRTDAEVETSVFGQRMWRTDSLEKTLMLEKTEGWKRRGNRGWDDWMASPTQWTWVWAISRSWWWTGKPGELQSRGSQRVRHNWVTELNWRGKNLTWGNSHRVDKETLREGEKRAAWTEYTPCSTSK